MTVTCKRIIFVTGASRGIGLGIAERLLDQGHYVAVGYNKNQKAAENLVEKYSRGFPVQVDIIYRSSIKKAIKTAQKHFGRNIEILINNGAIAQEKSFLEITDDDWDYMLSANLRGPFAFTQEVLPGMIETGWGRILNISSIGGQWGGFNQVHYAAAKAGVINFTQSMARIYSHAGITCNTIAPGLIATDMTVDELNTEAGKEKVRTIPAGRVGTVEEVASAVVFLCTDEAAYITGQTLNLNGGMYFG